MNAQPNIFALKTTASDVMAHNVSMDEMARVLSDQAVKFADDALAVDAVIRKLDIEREHLTARRDALSEDAKRTAKMAEIIGQFKSGQSGTTVAPKNEQSNLAGGSYKHPNDGGTMLMNGEAPATSDPVPALSEEQLAALEADIAAAASPQQKEAA